MPDSLLRRGLVTLSSFFSFSPGTGGRRRVLLGPQEGHFVPKKAAKGQVCARVTAWLAFKTSTVRAPLTKTHSHDLKSES